jgi:mannose-6-phosphate isomerase-like protein (cupin superfamily)
MNTTSTHTAEHYTWGEGCDGWHLLKSEHLSVIQEAMPPHTAEVAHSHRHSRQFFYVLSGALSIELADGTTRLGVGEGLHIAPGEIHRVMNSAETPAQFLVVSAPPSHGDRILV